MSYIFETSDFTVWSPSLNVGRLFLACVDQLEKQIQQPSGLVETMSDTIEVDPNKLAAFLHSISRWSDPSNESLIALLRGPVLHLLALLIATTGELVNFGECQFATDCIRDANDLCRRNFQRLVPPT